VNTSFSSTRSSSRANLSPSLPDTHTTTHTHVHGSNSSDNSRSIYLPCDLLTRKRDVPYPPDLTHGKPTRRLPLTPGLLRILLLFQCSTIPTSQPPCSSPVPLEYSVPPFTLFPFIPCVRPRHVRISASLLSSLAWLSNVPQQRTSSQITVVYRYNAASSETNRWKGTAFPLSSPISDKHCTSQRVLSKIWSKRVSTSRKVASLRNVGDAAYSPNLCPAQTSLI
jgi:hypothetical protein